MFGVTLRSTQPPAHRHHLRLPLKRLRRPPVEVPAHPMAHPPDSPQLHRRQVRDGSLPRRRASPSAATARCTPRSRLPLLRNPADFLQQVRARFGCVHTCAGPLDLVVGLKSFDKDSCVGSEHAVLSTPAVQRKGSATSGEAPGWRCRYASLAIGGSGTATAVVAAAPFEFA